MDSVNFVERYQKIVDDMRSLIQDIEEAAYTHNIHLGADYDNYVIEPFLLLDETGRAEVERIEDMIKDTEYEGTKPWHDPAYLSKNDLI